MPVCLQTIYLLINHTDMNTATITKAIKKIPENIPAVIQPELLILLSLSPTEVVFVVVHLF